MRGRSQVGKSGYSQHDGKSDDLQFLLNLFVEGKFKPLIERRFPLEYIKEVHAYAQTEHKVGNLSVYMSDSAAR